MNTVDAASGAAARCAQCGRIASLVAAPPTTAWNVLTAAGQLGPYRATELAGLFQRGVADWSSLVAQVGSSDFQAARHDAVLVEALRALMPSAAGRPSDAARLDARSDASTLADAFRSAPSIVAASQTLSPLSMQPVSQRKSNPSSWLPSAQSLLVVALIAFVIGVALAASWGTFGSAPTADLAPSSISSDAASEPRAAPPRPSLTTIKQLPELALPDPAQLQGELHRVSPDVRRCLEPSAVVVVDMSFEGATGRVRELTPRGQDLSPGRIECLTQAVRQIRVAPFRDHEHKLSHTFSP